MDHGYDEIWVFADPTGGLGEGAMVGPPGSTGKNLNGPIVTATAMAKQVPVMGYNYAVGFDNALHSYAHRASRRFAAVAGGNVKPTCLVNRSENNPYNHFTRLRHCYADGTATPMPTLQAHQYGSVGIVHAAHNRTILDNENISLVTVYGRKTAELSDADAWYDYPNLSAAPRPIGSGEWRSNQLGYLVWWFNHLPRYAGAATATPPPAGTPTPPGEHQVHHNMWPYIAMPQCFPEVGEPRDDTTPQP